jgi:hypothetical protein
MLCGLPLAQQAETEAGRQTSSMSASGLKTKESALRAIFGNGAHISALFGLQPARRADVNHHTGKGLEKAAADTVNCLMHNVPMPPHRFRRKQHSRVSAIAERKKRQLIFCQLEPCFEIDQLKFKAEEQLPKRDEVEV